MKITELDGDYQVTWAAEPMPPGFHEFPTARVRIAGGAISGADDGGVSWTGTIAQGATDNEFETAVTFDPRTGQPDAVVFHYDGSLKRELVTHRLVLKRTCVGKVVSLRGGFSIQGITFTAIARKV